ncbi:unnamed protein product [Cylicocyclus nassatus]|uniref:Uncharacterized protein n=1 Tax=Cylicocyclus nassatus TaxID=53992 RepID=A0AA36GIF7_CYLNA|nr:unnamed protein product [Cylicocyclus nassatus]
MSCNRLGGAGECEIDGVQDTKEDRKKTKMSANRTEGVISCQQGRIPYTAVLRKLLLTCTSQIARCG